MQNVLLIVLLLIVLLFGCKCVMKTLKVEGFEENNKKRIVFLLASWCGHCKTLKKSGVIDELKNDNEVEVEVNEDNDKANKKYNVNGFPSILKVNSNGDQVTFKGSRTAEKIKEFYLKE